MNKYNCTYVDKEYRDGVIEAKDIKEAFNKAFYLMIENAAPNVSHVCIEISKLGD